MAHTLSTTRLQHDRVATLPTACLLVIAFAALTALGAAVRVPLPHTPVPMTLQTLLVILAGLTLGPRLGAASQVVYLVCGLCGLPLFAAGSPATMGYLVGFIPAAWLAGVLRGPGRASVTRLIIAATAATLVIFAFGVGWLTWWFGALEAAVAAGLLPFIGGAVVKLGLAVTLAAGLPQLRSKRSMTLG